MELQRRQIIVDKSFSEYCYKKIRGCTEEQFAKIPLEYETYLVDDRSTWRFCHNMPKEVLDAVLTAIGVEWVQVYGPDEYTIAMSIFNAYNLYELPTKATHLAQKTAEAGVFATGSREVMASLHMLSYNTHTDAYELSSRAQEIMRMRNTVGLEFKIGAEIEYADNAYSFFNKLLTAQLSVALWLEREDKVSIHEMFVLSALYDIRPAAVTKEKIIELLYQDKMWKKLPPALESLIKKRYIASDKQKPVHKAEMRTHYYMITELGIELVMAYRNKVTSFVKKIIKEHNQ